MAQKKTKTLTLVMDFFNTHLPELEVKECVLQTPSSEHIKRLYTSLMIFSGLKTEKQLMVDHESLVLEDVYIGAKKTLLLNTALENFFQNIGATAKWNFRDLCFPEPHRTIGFMYELIRYWSFHSDRREDLNSIYEEKEQRIQEEEYSRLQYDKLIQTTKLKKKDLETLKSTKHDLCGRREELRKECDHAKAEMSKLKEHQQDLASFYATLSKDREANDEQLRELEEAVKDLKGKLVRSPDRLRGEIEGLKIQNAERLTSVQNFERNIGETKEKIDLLNSVADRQLLLFGQEFENMKKHFRVLENTLRERNDYLMKLDNAQVCQTQTANKEKELDAKFERNLYNLKCQGERIESQCSHFRGLTTQARENYEVQQTKFKQLSANYSTLREKVRTFKDSINIKESQIDTMGKKMTEDRATAENIACALKYNRKAQHRISTYLKIYSSPAMEKELEPLRAAVKEVGDLVRQLKIDGAPKIEVDKAVSELKARKKKLEDRELELAPKEAFFDRLKLEDTLKRRFFYDQSFSIYGGITGLYDFGPMGCSLKSNIIQIWRKHFILEDCMLEIECSALTPEAVLKASGHVERFVDWMVKDVKTGECFRADHLIKNAAEAMIKDKKVPNETKVELGMVLTLLDGYSNYDMHDIIKKYDFKSPTTGNNLTEPVSFNLMFPTQIGPTGQFKAFLRPETAQGIFINFKRLLEFNQGKLPFAAAQIGPGFRNEISPRQGLIRVREFTMCEIEHFVDPSNKNHAKFKEVENLSLNIFSACNQMDGKGSVEMTIGEAVRNGVVDNETLGYYMARTNQFLRIVGVDPARLRFRQHMPNEMAHYATDCWDAECLTSYGWIECVGHADRSCYDLQAHAKATNERLCVDKPLAEPIKVTVVKVIADKQAIGKEFRGDAKLIVPILDKLTCEEVEDLRNQLEKEGSYTVNCEGKKFVLKSSLLSVQNVEETRHVEEVTPSVVEPSFGIGRIMYVVLEHSFRAREGDEKRNYFQFRPQVAPIKCSILPISATARLQPLIQSVRDQLASLGLSYKIDDGSGSIGRRYARTDEIGIPFGVTVDFESEMEPHTVTLRDASSMQQIRLKIEDLGETVAQLVSEKWKWKDVTQKFPLFQAKTE